METLHDFLGEIRGGILLDVGTGDGGFLKLLMNHLSDYERMIGIDSEHTVLQAAKLNFSEDRIFFEEMFGENLKFETDTFDLVSISNTLHHLEDIDAVLMEMLRVLKPGGNFIINELICDGLNEKQLIHLRLHHLQAEIDTILGITHRHCLSREEITLIVSKLSLKDGRILIYENEQFNQNVQRNKLAERYHGLLCRLEGHPQYERYCLEFDQLYLEMCEKGIEFQSQLMYIGVK